jgi:signal transduction histidine kinase
MSQPELLFGERRKIQEAIEKLKEPLGVCLGKDDIIRALCDKIHTVTLLLQAKPQPVSLKVGEMPDRPITMPEYIAALERTIERLTEALERIERWANAYPLQVFLKPDLKKARVVLKDAGMTLDAISADAMRHVLDGVKDIVEQALKGEE